MIGKMRDIKKKKKKEEKKWQEIEKHLWASNMYV